MAETAQDYDAHKRSYATFTRMATWSTAVCAVIALIVIILIS